LLWIFQAAVDGAGTVVHLVLEVLRMGVGGEPAPERECLRGAGRSHEALVSHRISPT
jgi:hypothetical protein